MAFLNLAWILEILELAFHTKIHLDNKKFIECPQSMNVILAFL